MAGRFWPEIAAIEKIQFKAAQACSYNARFDESGTIPCCLSVRRIWRYCSPLLVATDNYMFIIPGKDHDEYLLQVLTEYPLTVDTAPPKVDQSAGRLLLKRGTALLNTPKMDRLSSPEM